MADAGIARGRLRQERKNWRKDHPHGFFARPMRKHDNSLDLLTWDCGIPDNKEMRIVQGLWEGGVYKLTMHFSEDYPSKPPRCCFVPPLMHPNIYPSGAVCLSILNESIGWKASINVKQILLGIQDLLDNPNAADPANGRAYDLYTRDRARYDEIVKETAEKMRPI